MGASRSFCDLVRCAAVLGLTGLGCEPVPQTLADCARLSAPSSVEECRYEKVSPLVADIEQVMSTSEEARVAARAALDATLGTIEQPSRDLLLLRLAIAHPKQSAMLCSRTQTDGASEKCRQVLGRPHLSGAGPR